MYLSATRPDVMYPVSLISRYMKNPTEMHLLATKRIFRCLQGPKDYGLSYKKLDLLALQSVITLEIKMIEEAPQSMFSC